MSDDRDKNLKYCDICFDEDDTAEENFITFKNCKHYFHKDCLLSYFKERIMSKSFPIVCPD
jgi:hypothetical protein